jgi:hypothetical protein
VKDLVAIKKKRGRKRYKMSPDTTKKIRHFKKTILIFSGTVLLIAAGIIIFISPLTKYLVEKYDQKYTGRQIEMDWAYVNPFTGYVHLDGLKIYELNSDSLFFSAKGVNANLIIRKLLSKDYIISELVLDSPSGIIIQDTTINDLNFRDLINRFTPKKSSVEKLPVHFSILNIKINNGTFYYRENTIPINYFIKEVNIESSGLHWDADTMLVRFSFLAGIGKGLSSGDLMLNKKNLDYRLSTVIKKFDLQFIEQYLKDLSNYGSFSANLDANIKAGGNLRQARNLKANGKLTFNDFHFGKNKTEDYTSFKRFKIDIIDLSPENKKYIFDSVVLDQPYFKYERYDHLDNIQTVFGKKGSKVSAVNANSGHFNLILEIAKYVEKLAKNFFRSYYKINRLEINSADLRFNDYSLSEKFAIGVDPLFIEADSIEKSRERIKLLMKSNIKPYGSLKVTLSVNPKDSSDFDLRYSLTKIPLTAFNPYLISYTSFPMDKGQVHAEGVWNVRNGNIHSQNQIVILHPHISKRIKNKDSKWIPMPLVMAFVRERREVIDYEVPVTGDLKDPKFHLKDVILDLLKNIVIKPPTTPKIFQEENIENEIENALTLKWELGQRSPDSEQEHFISEAAGFLKDHPEASLLIKPLAYDFKEKEHILFYEAKKKYFLLSHSRYSEEDSLFVEKMSVKDSSFTKYLNKQHAQGLVFTVHEKCYHFVGNDLVNNKYTQLIKQREKIFRSYFIDNGTEEQIKMMENKNEIPFNGFSFYKLRYKGKFPKDLGRLYDKAEKLRND